LPEDRPVITLLTDFGTADSYVAQMKGVMLQRQPAAQIIDITHEIPPQDIFRAACVLAEVYPHFPPDTVHVVVVDPGVGSDRRVLCLSAARQFFLAPDNGVLEFVLRSTRSEALVEVSGKWYFREDVSYTFHGRDIFAPVAGHLATGIKPGRLGRAVTDIVRLEVPEVKIEKNTVTGTVIHIDRFGNLITNIEKGHLAAVFQGVKNSQVLVRAAGREIVGLVRSYAEKPAGELLSLLGSSERLEIAVSGGSAGEELGVSQGAPVELLRLE
jgi:S-adenosylmethionine hydrolase